MRWLLCRFNISPNAYYNYLKHRKAEYYARKESVKTRICEIYHSHNGIDGYRTITVYLVQEGYFYSPATIHRYMNVELNLKSIVRPGKPEYQSGKPHKIFENLLDQGFTAREANRK